MAFSSKGLADSGDFGIPAELGFRLLKENGGVHMEAGSMDWCWRIGTPSAVTTATAESSLIHLLSGTVPTIREHELAKGGDGYGFSTFLANLWHPNLALCPPTDIVTTRIESPSSSSSNNITTANANTNTNTNTNTCVIESRGDSQVVPMKSHTSFHNDIIHCLGSSNLRLQTRESSEEARMETPQHFSCIGNYYTHASNITMPEEENNGYLGQARNASTQLLNNPLQFDNSQKKAGQFTLMDSHRPLQIVDDVSSTIQELGNINPAIQDLGNINLASPLDCTYTAPDVATNWQDHHLPCGKTKEADRNNVESLPWVNTYLANDDDTTTSNKEMVYRAAALMQPPASCYIGPVLADSLIAEARSTLRPKRKNVKISDDPQSVAARKRRHRISQKIEILQRMVPGGTKMDTASMLDEAVQYMKFLKAQVQMMEQLQQGLVHFPAPPPSHPLSSSPIPFAESNPPGMNPNSSFALPRSSPPSLL